MSENTEHTEGHYDVQEVEMGEVYTWRPESVVVECDCGEKLTLTPPLRPPAASAGRSIRPSSKKGCLTSGWRTRRCIPGAMQSIAKTSECLTKRALDSSGLCISLSTRPGLLIGGSRLSQGWRRSYNAGEGRLYVKVPMFCRPSLTVLTWACESSTMRARAGSVKETLRLSLCWPSYYPFRGFGGVRKMRARAVSMSVNLRSCRPSYLQSLACKYNTA
jgi:hypothetical protein